MAKRPALGRGLASLIPGVEESLERSSPEKTETSSPSDLVRLVPIGCIDVNRFQPRHEFDEAAIAELSESIRERGVLQPLLVRQGIAGRYELIAGERRLRASKLAGLEQVPVLFRQSSDLESLELALIENIQRENLNAIELARAFKALQDEFKYTQEEISKRVGKDRSTITNHLRLLKLGEHARDALVHDIISMGHARALLGIEDVQQQEQALNVVITKGLSVRETEELVKRLKEARTSKPKPTTDDNPELSFVTEKLRRAFQTRVDIVPRKKGGGEIRIEYFTPDELNRILELLPDAP